MSASPAAGIALNSMNYEIDIRHVLPAVRVPTLVLHSAGDLAHASGADHVLRRFDRCFSCTPFDSSGWRFSYRVSPDLPDAFAHPGRAGPAAGAPATGRFLQAGRGRMVSSLWMGSPPSAGASVEVDTPRMAMLHLPLGSLGIAASG